MRELVIGDVHFGIKSNNTDWLYKQCKLIDTQVINIIKNYNIDRVVFLGDVFDIRYSINQQVASEVKKSIRNLAITMDKYNGYVVFVAGNHDYYSPSEDASQYNAYETVFGDEFMNVHKNVYFVTQEPLYKDDSLFLPWYWTDNTEHFDDILYRYDFNDDVKAIYCHADLSVWPGSRIASLKNTPVYSGHIHFINEDSIANLYNIGACCALTFGDVNETRYLYILEDFKIKEKIPNACTPKFVKIYDEDIFDASPDLFVNSYVQICISKSNLNNPKYLDKIKHLKNTYIDANIRIHLLADDEEFDNNINASINTFSNINDYISTNIPKELTEKFNIIKEKYENT